jgi:hypothetical protein
MGQKRRGGEEEKGRKGDGETRDKRLETRDLRLKET